MEREHSVPHPRRALRVSSVRANTSLGHQYTSRPVSWSLVPVVVSYVMPNSVLGYNRISLSGTIRPSTFHNLPFIIKCLFTESPPSFSSRHVLSNFHQAHPGIVQKMEAISFPPLLPVFQFPSSPSPHAPTPTHTHLRVCAHPHTEGEGVCRAPFVLPRHEEWVLSHLLSRSMWFLPLVAGHSLAARTKPSFGVYPLKPWSSTRAC